MEFKKNRYFSQLASQRLTTLVSGGCHSVASPRTPYLWSYLSHSVASWEPLGGSPEPPQVRTRDRGFGGRPRSWLLPDTSVVRRWPANSQKYRFFLNSTMLLWINVLLYEGVQIINFYNFFSQGEDRCFIYKPKLFLVMTHRWSQFLWLQINDKIPNLLLQNLVSSS